MPMALTLLLAQAITPQPEEISMIETSHHGYPSRDKEAAIFKRREPVLHGKAKAAPLSSEQTQQFH